MDLLASAMEASTLPRQRDSVLSERLTLKRRGFWLQGRLLSLSSRVSGSAGAGALFVHLRAEDILSHDRGRFSRVAPST